MNLKQEEAHDQREVNDNQHEHHSHRHTHVHGVTSNIKVAFFLNITFAIIELIGGLFTNSVAILSDALHDLGDSLSLGLAWYLQRVSGRGRDKYYTYGYKRFSILGALINSVVLIVGSIFILQAAIPRLWAPQPTNVQGMMILAILGVVFNGLAIWRLKKGSSLNEKVVSLHLMEDILGWIAVAIGAVVIYFTDWFIIDPILSIGIAVFILLNVVRSLKAAMRIIMQGTPETVITPEVESKLKSIEGVLSLHDLHIWSLDGENNVLTVHLVMNNEFKNGEKAEFRKSVKEKLKELGIHHSTIEFEMPVDDCDQEDC